MDVAERLRSAEDTLHWSHQHIDQVRVPRMRQEKRVALAVPCFHAVIRHQQAVVLLVEEELEGSALALTRVVVEAFARGLWLTGPAADADVDRAGKDKFPGFAQIVHALEGMGKRGPLTIIKDLAWARLCSYTHTGFMQIGARLTEAGVDERFDPREIDMVLALTSICSVASVGAIAELADNAGLQSLADDRLRSGIAALPTE